MASYVSQNKSQIPLMAYKISVVKLPPSPLTDGLDLCLLRTPTLAPLLLLKRARHAPTPRPPNFWFICLNVLPPATHTAHSPLGLSSTITSFLTSTVSLPCSVDLRCTTVPWHTTHFNYLFVYWLGTLPIHKQHGDRDLGVCPHLYPQHPHSAWHTAGAH